MLITVSGPVGSGKSTMGAAVAARLSASGETAELVSFRTLPCFRLMRRRDAASSGYRREHESPRTIRRADYSREPLTAFDTGVHLVRILSFRAWRLLNRRRTHLVLNRYFYDSLSHYELDGAVSHACLRVLRAAIPRPDLALLLEAEVDTLASRRPEYSRAYLDTSAAAYRALSGHFPELLSVVSSPGLADDIVTRIRQAG